MTMLCMDVGNEILRQLGGAGRLKAMIGASNFTTLASTDKIMGGLVFTLPAFGRPRVNSIKIELNGKDLYDVTFTFTRRSKGTFVSKVVAEAKDVYCGMLKSVIEKNTGLYLSL